MQPVSVLPINNASIIELALYITSIIERMYLPCSQILHLNQICLLLSLVLIFWCNDMYYVKLRFMPYNAQQYLTLPLKALTIVAQNRHWQ